MKKFTLASLILRILLVGTLAVFTVRLASAADSLTKSVFTPILSAPLTEIDAPRKNALGDFGVSVANHVNGMARIGDWYVVNYGNRGGEQGRILFWKEGASDYAPPFTFDTRDVKVRRRSSNPRNPRPYSGEEYNPGGGKPEHMGAAGNYLAVAITGGDNIKFFDFSNPTRGVTEIKNARLSDGDGNLGFFYCPDNSRYYVLTGWGTMTVWESSAATLEETTSWTEVDSVDIPGAEAGFPVVQIAPKTFVVVSLGAGTGTHQEPYGFKMTTLTLRTRSGRTTISGTTESGSFTLSKGVAGGGPSFRWGGTVRMEGGNLAFYAAPKRLDASGNYYKWTAKKGTSGDVKVRILWVKCVETTERGEDEIFLRSTSGTRVPAGKTSYHDIDDGDTWRPVTVFSSGSQLAISLMEYDTENDLDLIGTFKVSPGETKGEYTHKLNGDDGQYEVRIKVE